MDAAKLQRAIEKIPPADGYIISYSGGKDSLALIDLTLRTGKRVVAFFMYKIPHLDSTQFICNYARQRFAIEVLELPHWSTSHDLREGKFRARGMDVPLLKVPDIENVARQKTGLKWVGVGYKKLDSLERRGMLTDWYKKYGEPVNPDRGVFTCIDDWSHKDVREHLAQSNIEVPSMDSGGLNGISLAPHSLAWLRTYWPQDYQRMLRYFPYAVAQADRVPMIEASREQRRLAKAAARKAAREQASEPDQTSDI